MVIKVKVVFVCVDEFEGECEYGFMWIWVDEYVFFWVNLEVKMSRFGDKFYKS